MFSPVLSCPVLSCPVLSCPVLSCPVLSCPLLSFPLLPFSVSLLPSFRPRLFSVSRSAPFSHSVFSLFPHSPPPFSPFPASPFLFFSVPVYFPLPFFSTHALFPPLALFCRRFSFFIFGFCFLHRVGYSSFLLLLDQKAERRQRSKKSSPTSLSKSSEQR